MVYGHTSIAMPAAFAKRGGTSMGSGQQRVSPMGHDGSVTRRNLVRVAAAATAAVAMPRHLWAAADEVSPVMDIRELRPLLQRA
jgi:hypothetical protein